MELLADITFRLTAHEVARLWFCGSKLLNLKLHDGGAPIFDFRLEHVSDFKWPTLVASLAHLRQFSISIALGNCASLSDSLDFWELVPKSVQKLDLTAGLGLSQLARFLQLHGDKGLPNLVSFSFMNPGKDMIELFPTLGTFFPNLQTLDIQALPNQAVASHRLVIAYLPRTLTALKISSSFLCFSADDAPTRLAEWPSGMAALAISNTPFSFTPDLLPRALQSLILQHIHTASASSFDWASLPCGLETLSLHSLDFLKAVDLLRMPSLLRHSLRMLECTTRSISPLTGSEQWVSETLALIEALPPNLTSLYYHFGATLTQEHIVRLPKGLKSMIASSIPTKPSLVPFVPAQFETLCIHVGEEEWPKSQKISESVKHITIKSLLDGAVPVDLREELTLEMVLKNLPSHLERFEFTGHTMTPREILLLPRGLREFITSAKLAGEACLVNMPPHLTRLCYHGYPKRHTALSTPPTYLSRTLTDLSLEKVSINHPDWFSALPDSLGRLYIRYKGRFTSRHASCLPRLLSHLHLNWTKMESTGLVGIAEHLPPKLLILTFESRCAAQSEGSALQNEDLAGFPRSIAQLSLPRSPKLDVGCFKYLDDRISWIVAGPRFIQKPSHN